MSLGFVPGAPYAQAASWSDPRVTKLYKAAAGETNDHKRNQLTSELMTIFRDQGPYVVWAFEAGPQFFNVRIGGIENSAIRPLNGFTLKKFFVKSS
jgi:ABC-type transport system substrate-binding protein